MEKDFELEPEVLEAMEEIMKPRVIDGEMYVAADGIREMIDAYARQVVAAALNGQTCAHGVSMSGEILDNLDALMDQIDYVHAGDFVPDTIPDDILGE